MDVIFESSESFRFHKAQKRGGGQRMHGLLHICIYPLLDHFFDQNFPKNTVISGITS